MGAVCARWGSTAASDSRRPRLGRRGPRRPAVGSRAGPGPGEAEALLFRPEASGALGDLTVDDVVLLTGEATDRITTGGCATTQLSAGCALAWWRRPTGCRGARPRGARPRLLDHVAARHLEPLLETATVDGVPWHTEPREALDAMSAQVAVAPA